jgi:dihydroorotate dehydrogenase
MAITIGRVVWPGPVGIGAGIIKGAEAFKDYAHRADSVEVGSITKQMRRGNDGQTVWKYVEERGLRHFAGMPNPGAMTFAELFHQAQYEVDVPWGMNVAVSPGITDPVRAAKDVGDTVLILLEGGLMPDWITFNISSPDTEDTVPMMSEPGRVRACVQAIKQAASLYNIPVWLKISPTLQSQLNKALAEILISEQIQAVIVSNAMPDSRGLHGGWCGEPVRAYMLATLWEMNQLTEGNVPMVATGGIFEGAQVKEALEAGARAVQVVSATLFRGRDAATLIKREYEMTEAKELTQQLMIEVDGK